MTAGGGRSVRFGDLGVRVLSGITVAALALLALWLGGAWVALLAALATALMLWEMHRMVTAGARPGEFAVLMMILAGTGAVVVTGAFGIGPGALVLAVGAAGAATVAREKALWCAGGLVYIGFAMAYLIVIRDDPDRGLATVLWLILVVVAADVGAYFAGRAFGGARLWPAVSPGKTWSGAAGGLALAVAVGVAFAATTGGPLAGIAAVSLGIAVASQFGDLLESAVKRHWGVKDASAIIPGHGGVMDRLDGLMGGLWFFALYDMLGGTLGG